MNFEFLILTEYNQFVWPAFIFTFLSCFFLFFKTEREFKKQEKLFLKEFGDNKDKKDIVKKKERVQKVWSAISTY